MLGTKLMCRKYVIFFYFFYPWHFGTTCKYFTFNKNVSIHAWWIVFTRMSYYSGIIYAQDMCLFSSCRKHKLLTFNKIVSNGFQEHVVLQLHHNWFFPFLFLFCHIEGFVFKEMFLDVTWKTLKTWMDVWTGEIHWRIDFLKIIWDMFVRVYACVLGVGDGLCMKWDLMILMWNKFCENLN